MDDPNPTRCCQRLVSIIRQHGDAGQLQTIELLQLADWISQPVTDADAWQWCETTALPLIRELGQRLQRQIDSSKLNIPSLLAQVSAMRQAQSATHCSKGTPRETKLALAHAAAVAESRIDQLIEQHYQPSLF